MEGQTGCAGPDLGLVFGTDHLSALVLLPYASRESMPQSMLLRFFHFIMGLSPSIFMLPLPFKEASLITEIFWILSISGGKERETRLRQFLSFPFSA